MNMHDLARDDDFLSHLLVEKLGTGDIPLLVHKMEPSRRLPKTNPEILMAIVQRVCLIFLSPTPSRQLTRYFSLDSSFQPRVLRQPLSMML
jgi:hypothetical protein